MATTPHKKGFTIIETTIAFGFISFIMLSITIIIMQVTRLYRKGISLRAVNSIGQSIVSEMTTTISSASTPFPFKQSDFDDDLELNNDEIMNSVSEYFVAEHDAHQRQEFGAFCIGGYSYIWVTPSFYNDANRNSFKITYGSASNEITNPRLIRTIDIDAEVCDKPNPASPTAPIAGKLSQAATGGADLELHLSTEVEPVELIQEDESDIWLYDLSVSPIGQSKFTYQGLVSVNFILGTKRGGVNILSSGDFCQGNALKDDGTTDASESFMYEFQYCAVNKFNFSVRTGGSSEKKG